jgi:pimeloyl-ACP methyl ester carboxylesterase
MRFFFKRLITRWLLAFFGSVAWVFSLCLWIEKSAELKDAYFYPPPGEMIDIGNGVRLHINCVGTGSPVVLMEAGLSCSSPDWRLVQPGVSQGTRVCTYDRAGLGWSDKSEAPRTGPYIAQELHRLLGRKGESPPFVLVGHSIGGLYVRQYAAMFPEEVKGIVLVDSSHEEMYEQLPRPALKLMEETYKPYWKYAIYAKFGGIRFDKWWYPEADVWLEGIRLQSNAIEVRPEKYETTYAEYSAFEESASQLRAANWRANIPLVVLTQGTDKFPSLPAAQNESATKVWRSLQAELANRSPQGEHIIVEGSGHFIHLEKPEVVIQSIFKVVKASRR